MPFPLEEKYGLFITGPPAVEPNLEEKEDRRCDGTPDVSRDIRESTMLILWLSQTRKIMTGVEAKCFSIIKKKALALEK